jgi:hypothetical protein
LQHYPRLGIICRFPENHAVHDDRRIGRKDEAAGFPAAYRLRLIAGHPQNVLLSRLAGQGILVDFGRIDLELNPRRPKQLRAPRRGGGKNQHRHILPAAAEQPLALQISRLQISRLGIEDC